MRPRRMAAEIGAGARRWSGPRPASMRPRRMAAEIAKVSVMASRQASSFNEAAANGRGNPMRLIRSEMLSVASMRPRRMAAEISRGAKRMSRAARLQ